MNLKEIHNIYFIGIGGIGMSALAKYFHANGKQVAGYDKTPSNITNSLENNGAKIHYKDALDKIEAGADLVQIYTGFIYEGPGLIKKINKALLKS